MDLSDAYANGPFIAHADSYPPRWADAAARLRADMAADGRLREGLSYGPGGRNRFDLVLPIDTPRGLLVFVHGGYWMTFGRADWTHLAGGATARGWAVALPSYDHCPDVRIADITLQIAMAVMAAAVEVSGPIRLAGHSAGGHLVARMLAPGMLPEAVAGRVDHVMPISPLADLRPLLQTQMNQTLRLDPDEAWAESPVAMAPPQVPVTVWVGGDERPAFVDQARWLSQAWGCPLVIDEGRHHFDVIDGLADAASPITARLLD
ncbi:esterase [Salipiger aestuarii]|uniref:alpha/beta hydrolase n=1 Tax=Salipiger aestuarii TaxID=568098 RepID=UPI00025B6AA8|nr:alpha/beta hydrolase [Salipiger aestuarii]EIE50229.1 putative esterase/lipase/thioesterase [Citreicella sp. 357]KAA8606924.1 esterase [Salipiger aestuarii]